MQASCQVCLIGELLPKPAGFHGVSISNFVTREINESNLKRWLCMQKYSAGEIFFDFSNTYLPEVDTTLARAPKDNGRGQWGSH